MKKVFITLSVIMLTAMSAFAQSGDETTRYNTPKWNQGWFIDLAGTYSVFASTGSVYHKITTYYGGFNSNAKLRQHQFGLSGKIGRRVSPSLAVRIGYDRHLASNMYAKDFMFKSLHLDVMESPLDLFFGYNPDRLFTVWVYAGIGLTAFDQTSNGHPYNILIHPFRNSNIDFGFHGGFMNNFRLSNSLDLHVDLTAVATRWTFDVSAYDAYAQKHAYMTKWHRAHFDFTGMVGLMYYLGGRRFDAAEVRTIESDCSEQENRIKELTKELENCRANQNNGTVVVNQPCDTIVKFVEGESLSYPFSIFFNKGSYELRDGRDRVNLEEFANAAKKNGYKIILRGTCDSATASSAFNQTLAENRCNKVKAELIKLGVPESNITINPVGGVKELTPTEYDRRVLIQVSK